MERRNHSINIDMKKLVLIFGLVIASLSVSCQETNQSKDIQVISPQEVRDAVFDDNSHQLIDVRTVDEFKEGHLKNAQNICVTDGDFEENVAKLDKDQPVYLYCRSGKRSAKAAEILKDLGFKEIYDMDGGILNWKSENLEIEN